MTCTPYGINTHRLIVQARRVAYNGEDDAPAKTVQAIITRRWTTTRQSASAAVPANRGAPLG